MSPSELKILVVSPSVKNWPLLLGGGLLVVMTGVTLLVLLIINFQSAILVMAAGVALTVWPALNAANTEYWITSARVVARGGIFRANEVFMAVADIRDIRIERTSLQRTLGVGDITLIGAAGNLRLSGVEDPEGFRDKIRTVA